MPLLFIENLNKSYGGVVALRDFGMTLEDGDLIGLIGPNGAGKTTAFNVMTGVVPASQGTVRFTNIDVTRAKPERRANLGMIRTFQNIRLFDDLTVHQNVMAGAHATEGAPFLAAMFGLRQHRIAEDQIRAIADEAMNRTGIEARSNDPAGSLSYGDRRRVEIARALAGRPRLLLLDEPAAGMNDAEKRNLTELIRQLNQRDGLAIVLVEHNVPMVAAICPRVIVLNKGEVLADGPTADVLRQSDVAEVYLGRRAAKGAPR